MKLTTRTATPFETKLKTYASLLLGGLVLLTGVPNAAAHTSTGEYGNECNLPVEVRCHEHYGDEYQYDRNCNVYISVGEYICEQSVDDLPGEVQDMVHQKTEETNEELNEQWQEAWEIITEETPDDVEEKIEEKQEFLDGLVEDVSSCTISVTPFGFNRLLVSCPSDLYVCYLRVALNGSNPDAVVGCPPYYYVRDSHLVEIIKNPCSYAPC